jgi:hypothetical protein
MVQARRAPRLWLPSSAAEKNDFRSNVFVSAQAATPQRRDAAASTRETPRADLNCLCIWRNRVKRLKKKKRKKKALDES